MYMRVLRGRLFQTRLDEIPRQDKLQVPSVKVPTIDRSVCLVALLLFDAAQIALVVWRHRRRTNRLLWVRSTNDKVFSCNCTLMCCKMNVNSQAMLESVLNLKQLRLERLQ